MSTRKTLSELAEIFCELLEIPQAKRDEWMERLELQADDAAQIRKMLRVDADVQPGFLDESAVLHAHAMESGVEADIEPQGLIGQMFGAFKVERLLGQGGMATVFLARRMDADFDQTVAVKVLRRGLYSSMEQKLFRRERRLLAQLNHANIAHIVDGGVTEAGIPYLVMEYVDGLRLDHYVVEHRLDLRARLRLFIECCRAVESAHQALIVHRDIKPSNILVTRDGKPKLLDFGIAKLLTEDNYGDSPYRTLTAALTPGYAAPEQMAGRPVTTATDVYALGVVLHELLIGKRPDDQDTVLLSSALIDKRSQYPGRLPMPAPELRKVLRGDLDNIVARALSPEPERRYSSAAALIDDLERYLAGRPVRAHPRSRWYVLKKFARRHRPSMWVTVMFAVAVLVSLAAVVHQARVARIEASRANTVRDFLIELLDAQKADLPPDQQPTPAALAKSASARIKQATNLPELTRADLLHTLGQVSFLSGSYADAGEQLEEATEIRSRLLGPTHADTLSTRLQLAVNRAEQGRLAEAAAMIDSLLPSLRDKPTSELVEALGACTQLYALQGNNTVAMRCQLEELDVAKRILEPGSIESLEVQLRYGDYLGHLQRSQEAIAVLEETLKTWRAAGYSQQQTYYLNSLNNLGVAYHTMEEEHLAIPVFEEVLAARRVLNPAGHPDVANSLASLGAVMMGARRFDEADALLQEATAMTQRFLGDSHPTLVYRLLQLSANERRRSRMIKAAQYARRALELCEGNEVSDPIRCAHVHQSLADALIDTSAAESLVLIDNALVSFKREYQAPNARIAAAMNSRASILLSLDRAEEALEQVNEAIDMFAAEQAEETVDGMVARHVAAKALLALQRGSESLAMINAMMPAGSQRLALRPDLQQLILETRARSQLLLGSKAAAVESARDALAISIDPATMPASTTEFLLATAGVK